MSITCSSCRAPIAANATFCGNCGSSLTAIATVSYFYIDNNQQFGPVDQRELVQLLEAGSLAANTQVWREGSPNWTTALTTPGLAWAQPAIVRVAQPGGRTSYRCPFCENEQYPITRRRTSGGAWLIFALLLITGVCLPICWVPLVLMKENYLVCSVCGASPEDADVVVNRTRIGRLN